MVKEFEKLTEKERELLYKAPVLFSVFASCSFNKVNAQRKADAINLARLKTFTANYLLLPYYNEVEKHFRSQFELIAQKYFPFDETKINALEKEIENIDHVINKLDARYGQTLRSSLERFARHVRKSYHSVFQDFIFPLYMHGLNS
jgi:hypothetical protein